MAGVGVEVLGVGQTFMVGRTPVQALVDVSLALPAGRIGAIIGPSGCGKSTLLRLLADLLPTAAGEVRLGGGAPWQLRRRKEISFAFQAPTLLPWKTVADNILLPAITGPRATRRGRDDQHLARLLNLIGLTEFAAAYPHQLSGGMQQRVAIARALYPRPRLLLMDEPFGALDELTRERLNLEIGRILRESGTTVVLVTHSIAEAVFMADRVWVMSPRPGTITRTIDVDLPPERSLDQMNSDQFRDLVARLRHELHAEARR